MGGGTTVVRALEVAAEPDGRVRSGPGSTDLFIRPPSDFRVVDAVITNIHLPRSTLLMLAAAFGGYERVMAACEIAVREGYRFYSYGDAMALVRDPSTWSYHARISEGTIRLLFLHERLDPAVSPPSPWTPPLSDMGYHATTP